VCDNYILWQQQLHPVSCSKLPHCTAWLQAKRNTARAAAVTGSSSHGQQQSRAAAVTGSSSHGQQQSRAAAVTCSTLENKLSAVRCLTGQLHWQEVQEALCAATNAASAGSAAFGGWGVPSVGLQGSITEVFHQHSPAVLAALFTGL
jgi:hypothetical protein